MSFQTFLQDPKAELMKSLPIPNDTRVTWQLTVDLFTAYGLYNGETPKKLAKKHRKSEGIERQLWLTLIECLLALAGKPSMVTGIVQVDKSDN